MNDVAAISLAGLASGMGNVTRLRVLRELAGGEPLMTVQIAERIGVKDGTLTRHMRHLLKAGLILQSRAGLYFIPAERIISAEERVLDYGTCLLRLGKK